MEELQKNDFIELLVTGEGTDGEGVGKVDGKTVFLRGALKGERVRAKVILVKPRFNVAVTDKILKPSPQRITPPCPVFGKCGGCDLQHMKYAAQLEYKRRLVKDTLLKIGGIDEYVEEVEPSLPEYGYRNKISLPVRQFEGGALKIGLFAKNSHRVVETETCLLQNEKTAAVIPVFIRFMEESGFKGYDEQSGEGDVRHVVAREAGGVLYVTVVACRKIDCRDLTERIRTIDPDAEIWLNVNRRRDNVILGDEWHCLKESNKPSEVENLKTHIHPAGFFQVNDYIREKLYAAVADMMKGGAAVEAYSGAGLLSAMLAKKAKIVFGIEINPQAHGAAVKMKELNGIDNFFPVLGDVGEKLPAVLDECAKSAPVSDIFIVLDPPRTGISQPAADTLVKSGANNIVYVSCNPATLARDAARLIQGGYSPVKIKPFDMFPQTCNVETLMLLSKKKPDSHIEVDVESGER